MVIPHGWLAPLYRFFQRSGKKRQKARPRRRSDSNYYRLSFECLEEREMPAALLTVTPITWNVIGLDSNNVNAGPDLFLVGARVTNTSTAGETLNNVRTDYLWDSANAYINLEAGSPTTQNVPTLAAGASADFYYNVIVTRNTAAYFTARSYHISASSDEVGPVNTPMPRELYVEKLVSQFRNNDLSITGPSTVYVGGTYTYHLTSSTAPGGYEQLESFLTFSVNYRIVSVATTYTAPTGATNDKVYADAGGWDNDPASIYYRTTDNPAIPDGFTGGKAGGIIETDFTITILSAGSVSVTALIYDKSGSSYHYNSDFGTLAQAISNVDNAPVANNDSAAVNEDSAVVVNVLANDTDANNNLAPSTVVVGTGPTNGSVVVNATTGAITYTPTANFSGTDSFTYTVKDTGNNTSNVATVSVTVAAINDPPLNTVPGTQTTPQNIAKVFSSGNSNQISIADIDAGSNPVQVTLTAVSGAVTLFTTSNLTFYAGDGTADSTMSFTGTIANINAALNGLSFNPTANFNGTASLTITTYDQGNTGSGGPFSDEDTVNITVTSLNQPPVNTVPGTQLLPEGQNRVFSTGNGNAISVFDVDAGSNPIVVTLSVGSGTLTAVPTGGVTIDNNGTATVTLTGAQAAINSALNGLTFAPVAGFSGDVTLNVSTNDQGFSGNGGAQSDSDNVLIRVAPANEAPVNTVPGAQTFDEDVARVFSSGNGNQISIADADAGTATVQVALSVTSGTLSLNGTANLLFISGDGSADASMTILGTITDINTALNGLTYTPTANFFGTATLTITTNDLGNTGSGGAKSDSDPITLNVTSLNDAPIVNLPNPLLTGGLQLIKNKFLTFSATKGNAVTITDVDASAGLVLVTVTDAADTGTRLNATATAGVTITGANTNVLTLEGTVANVNLALDGLVYDPTNSSTGAHSMQVTCNDQGNTGSPGALSDTKTLTITLVATSSANDPPVNVVPAAQTTNRNTDLVFSSGNGNAIYTTDVDAGSDDITTTLTVTSGTLQATNAGLTTFTGNGTASISLTGTVYEIYNTLNGLIFRPTTGFTGSVTLTMDTSDGGNNGTGGAKSDNGDTVIITVSGVNAAPTNTVPSSQIMAEDATLTFSSGNGNLVSIADPDAGTNDMLVTLTAVNGILTLSTTTGLTFQSGTTNGSNNLIFTGTISAINTALAGMNFNPTANFAGTASFTINTNDQGNTGTGTPLSDNDSVSITVTPINDGPVNTVPGVQTIDENTTRTFSSGIGNQISVTDPDSGSSQIEVTLSVDLANTGTLTLGSFANLTFTTGDGTADASMTFLGTVADINTALNGLFYTPPTGFSGSTTITILSNDRGNTGSGPAGTDTDSVTINVNAVNDPPVNTVPGAQSTNEEVSRTFSTANGNRITVADPDAAGNPIDVTLSVNNGIVTIPDLTGLTVEGGLNGSLTVTVRGDIATLNARLDGLIYTPNTNFSGTDTLTVLTNDRGFTGGPPSLTDSDPVSITVYPVNDAPVNTIPLAVQTTDEELNIVFSSGLGNPITIADVDAGSGLVQVTLTAANGTVTLGGIIGLTFVTGDGSGDAVTTFQGTIAAINTALNNLTFAPTPNFAGTTTLKITTNDLGNVGLGGALQDIDTTINLFFNPLDDAPVNTVPAAQSASENTALFFNNLNGNLISIADVDAGAGEMRMILSVTNGTLTLSSVAGLSFTDGNGIDDATMTFTGTLSAVNTALAGMRYNPTTNFTGSATLTIDTNDQSNTGSGGPKFANNSVSITVSPINDPPVLSVPGLQTFVEDTVRTFSTALGNLISISDPDAGGSSVEFSISAADGTLTLATNLGLTFVRGDGTSDAALTFRGTIAAINTALDGMFLTPTLHFNGDSYLVVAVNDLGNSGAGGPKIDADYVLLTLTSSNDAPVQTAGVGATLTVVEDSGLTPLGLNFAPGGGSDETAQTLTYTVTAVPSSIGDVVLADGTTLVTASTSYTLTQVQGMQFKTRADLPGGPATFSLSVTDNGTTNGVADPKTLNKSVSITVTEINETPVRTAGSVDNLTLPPAAGMTSLGLGGVTYGKGGGPDENSQTLTYTVTAIPAGALGTVYLADGTTPVTAATNYSLLQIQGMQFLPTGATGSGAFTFTVTDDGTTNSVADPKSLTQSLTILVTADNPAVVDLNGASGGINYSATFTEQAGAVLVVDGTALTVTDPEDPNLVSASVTISNLLDGTAESLSATASGAILAGDIVYNSGTGTLTITRVAALADYQAVLRTVSYNNTSLNPNTTNRTINFVVNDGILNNNPLAVTTLTIVPVNDPPVVDLNGAGVGINFTASFTEDGGAVSIVGATALTVADVDNTTLASATVTISNLQDGAAESLSASASGAILAGDIVYNSGTGELTITRVASLADYQAVLRGVQYNNTSQNPSTTSRIVNFTVNDGTDPNSPLAVSTVTVAANNDLPVVDLNGASGGINYTATFTEDLGAVAIVDAAALTVSDVDNTTLASATVTISNLQDGAAESLSATASGAILAGDIVYNSGTGALTITRVASLADYQAVLRGVQYNNASQNPNTTSRVVTFAVNDGTAANSPLATSTVTVVPVNDQPVVDLNGGGVGINYTATFTEDGGAASIVDNAALTVTDVDNTTLTSATVTISNLQDGAAESLSATASGAILAGDIVYNSGTGTLTITRVASLADYQTVLRGVQYNNASQNPGTTSRIVNFTVNDGTDPNSPLAVSTVTVVANNDLPIVDLNGGGVGINYTATFTEDGPTVAIVDAAGLTVADIDNTTLASATVTIGNLLDGAAESLSATASGAILAGDIVYNSGTGALTITRVASLADYQAVLRGVQYNNSSQNPNTTSRVVTFAVNDGTAANSPLATSTVSVVPVNDRPIVDLNGGGVGINYTASFTEDAGAVSIVDNAALTVTDVDNTTLTSATVTISNLQDGVAESLSATASGAILAGDIVYNSGTGTLTITRVASLADYQAVLRGVQYNNVSQNPSTTSRIVNFTVNDGTDPNSPLAVSTVTVAANNDLPVVDLNGGGGGINYTATFTEDLGAVAIVDAAALTVNDVDNTTLASATVTISNLQDGAAESLSATASGAILAGDIVYNSVTGALTITRVASLADYQAVLRGVQYNNASQNPNATSRVVTFAVNDGTAANSPLATSTVSVVPVNDRPVVDLNGASGGINHTASFTEDGGAVSIVDSSALTVSDVDNTTLASATITITNQLDGTAESLSATASGAILAGDIVYNSGTGVLTITRVASLANYQTVLRGIQYNNASQNPNTTDRVITFAVNDGTDANSPLANSTVTIVAVNDRPIVDLNGPGVGINYTTVFTEDGFAVNLVDAAALTVNDADSTTLASASAAITNIFDGAAESLSATASGAILAGDIVYNSGTGVLTITRVASLADYQAVLRSVQYNDVSQNPNTTDRIINFTVNDGTLNNSPVAVTTLTVAALNDAPAAAAQSVSTPEDTAKAISLAGTDVDGAAPTVFKITGLPGHGQLFDGGHEITAAEAAAGYPLTSGNAAQYVPDLDYNGPDSFTFKANDGMVDSGNATVSIAVTPVDDAPPPTVPQPSAEDTLLVDEAIVITMLRDTQSFEEPVVREAAEAVVSPAALLTDAPARGRAALSPRLTTFSPTFIAQTLTPYHPLTFKEDRLVPSSLSGVVYLDVNNNGFRDDGEEGLRDAVVVLSGTDDQGHQVMRTVKSDRDGSYNFVGLRPGNYSVSVERTRWMADRFPTVGNVGGQPVNRNQVSDIVLPPGATGVNYNFGKEKPVPVPLKQSQLPFDPDEALEGARMDAASREREDGAFLEEWQELVGTFSAEEFTKDIPAESAYESPGSADLVMALAAVATAAPIEARKRSGRSW